MGAIGKIVEANIFLLDKKALRAEIRRLSQVANKRIQRLEAKGWGDAPALRVLKESGQAKFGVKGKNHQEVQTEAARLLKFLNSETSSIRGAEANIRQIATVTGMKVDSKADLQKIKSQAAKFFELANKIKQYLASMQDSAAALDYRMIWNSINQYTQGAEIDLSAAEVSVEDLISQVDEILSTARRSKFDDAFLKDFGLL